MMENNFYDGSVTAGIVPNTHFFQEVEVVYKPRKSLELSSKIRCSRDAFLYIKEFFKSFVSHHEEVWMILLNSHANNRFVAGLEGRFGACFCRCKDYIPDGSDGARNRFYFGT